MLLLYASGSQMYMEFCKMLQLLYLVRRINNCINYFLSPYRFKCFKHGISGFLSDVPINDLPIF